MNKLNNCLPKINNYTLLLSGFGTDNLSVCLFIGMNQKNE